MDHLTVEGPARGGRLTNHWRASTYSLVTVIWALIGGLAAGAVVWAMTGVVEGLSLSGPGWSLSGNGALGVLAAGAVAVLGGGWAAIAAWAPWPRRLAVTAVAFLATLALALAWSFLPVLWPAPLWPQVVEGGAAALVVLAAVVGLILPRLAGVRRAAPLGGLRAALLFLLVPVVLLGLTGALVGFVLLPLLVTLPLLVQAGRTGDWRWLLAACGAVLVGLVIGGGMARFWIGIG